MNCIIEDEFKDFLYEISSPDFEIGRYIDISSYEDDYGHNEIEEAMEKLAEKIKLFLKESMPNKYLVTTGWCVHVMTPERARKSRFSEQTIESCLIKEDYIPIY